MTTDKISALKRTQLFGELEEPELRALAERAVERRLARDEILFVAGNEARGLFVIASGALSRLQQNGFIQIDGRQGAVCEEQALEIFAEG
jgi:CRP/FNR family transcriptional regulator